MARPQTLLIGVAAVAAAAIALIVTLADESVAHPEPENPDNIVLHGDEVTLPEYRWRGDGPIPVDEGYIVVIPYNQIEAFRTQIGDDRFDPGPQLADRGRLPTTGIITVNRDLPPQDVAPWPTIELPSDSWQLELTPGPQTICWIRNRDTSNRTYCLVVDLQRSTRLQFDADIPDEGAVSTPDYFQLD